MIENIWIKDIIVVLLCVIGYRARGGMFEQWGFRLPLCKFWWCTLFTFCAVWLTGNTNWEYVVALLIGSKLSTSFCGWGEAIGCALGIRKPDPHEMNELDFDEFCDNFGWDAKDIKLWKWTIHIPAFHLIDHSELYGVVWLTLRGILLSYLIGSPMNNLWFMLCGAPMGILYWFSGWLYRHGLNDGKSGWRTAEYIYSGYLGIMLCVCTQVLN